MGVKTPRRCFDALHADGRHETSLKRGERGGVGVEGRGNGGSRPRQRATRAPRAAHRELRDLMYKLIRYQETPTRAEAVFSQRRDVAASTRE